MHGRIPPAGYGQKITIEAFCGAICGADTDAAKMFAAMCSQYLMRGIKRYIKPVFFCPNGIWLAAVDDAGNIRAAGL